MVRGERLIDAQDRAVTHGTEGQITREGEVVEVVEAD
jgi:hypothetical protein